MTQVDNEITKWLSENVAPEIDKDAVRRMTESALADMDIVSETIGNDAYL